MVGRRRKTSFRRSTAVETKTVGRRRVFDPECIKQTYASRDTSFRTKRSTEFIREPRFRLRLDSTRGAGNDRLEIFDFSNDISTVLTVCDAFNAPCVRVRFPGLVSNISIGMRNHSTTVVIETQQQISFRITDRHTGLIDPHDGDVAEIPRAGAFETSRLFFHEIWRSNIVRRRFKNDFGTTTKYIRAWMCIDLNSTVRRRVSAVVCVNTLERSIRLRISKYH